MTPRTSIGVEIEVNRFNRRLETSMSRSVWSTAPEHCGMELKSVPCGTPGEIKKLVRSLEKMNIAAGDTPGFENTGTHIHIDFLKDIKLEKYDLGLKRINAAYINGRYLNPTGSGKKYYWISPDGSIWSKPKDYASYVGANGVNPSTASRIQADSRYLNAVKRFLALGIRFANPLFGLQHPDRRFNKYCHTLAFWSEETLFSCRSIHEICHHPNLLQGHRRHMFNLLAFPKYGTVEIRMVRGSLSPDELWPQIFLFGKMAKLAKSSEQLPNPSGNIVVDFTTLLDACDIHGKMRRSLMDAFSKNSSVKTFNIRCYRCERYDHFGNYSDFGLSRGVCNHCIAYTTCAYCGNESEKSSSQKLDDRLSGGRYLCASCLRVGVNVDWVLNQEKRLGSVHILGEPVGSGVGENGPIGLGRMIALFS